MTMKITKYETLEAFCAAFCDEPKPFGIPDGREAEPCGVIYRGSALRADIFGGFDGYSLGSVLPDGFEEVNEWASRPYRFVWKHDGLRAIVTYCEHDVCVTIDDTVDAYQNRLASAHRFYREY